MTPTVTDLFCGAGGSSHGAEFADFRAECQRVRGG
jgi:site-specific DNA-cytosine methylase